MGIGDWGLGIGPNPQSPIPNPQSPTIFKIYIKYIKIIIILKIKNKNQFKNIDLKNEINGKPFFNNA